jgi:hypothetical protein
MQLLVLVLGLAASTFFGCTNLPASPHDPSAERGVRTLEQQLETYHLELMRLVEAGELNTKQAEKFYQIARVETVRRIARLDDQQHHTAMDASATPASRQPATVFPPGLGYSPP